jgi:Zn-dependent M28 family amino/carboxypeptidase
MPRLTAAAVVLTVASVSVGHGQSATVDRAQLLRDLETLASDAMEGRQPGTPGGDKARAYVTQRFKEAGIQPIGESYERPFTFTGRGNTASRTGVNIVGVIRGTKTPDRYIAVTAHYDHLGVQKGQIYNGADDNASGVAALLAIAARTAAEKPAHSLLFVAFDAEEEGLKGSIALMKDPPVARESILLNVNIDMVGRDEKNVLFAVGTRQRPFLKHYLENVAQPPVDLRFGHDDPATKQDDWTRDSDQFPFHEAGIPFIYFGDEDDAQHHKPTDDVETITREFFVGSANTILAALRVFDANLEAIAEKR